MSCFLHISFFQRVSFVIFILTVIYTAMVRQIEQFLLKNFIEKHCFEIFELFFCLHPNTFITCSKTRFQLIGRETHLLCIVR